ncbi:predicted protein [Postia placenta Mad-698-R]|nr:predicted protein [Postia placenta Mad-698-R]
MQELNGDISLLAHTQLQDDWTVQSPLSVLNSTAGLALNTDGNGRLNVFYISGTAIFNAYQDLQADANTVQTWTVENTRFPQSVTPKFIDSFLLPSGGDYVAVVASDSNVYTLNADQRYPTWTLIKNTVNVAPLAVTPFYTSDGVLQIAALMSNSRVFLINPTTGTWAADGAVHVASQSVTDFKVSQIFAGIQARAKWGYLLSGKLFLDGTFESGVATVTSNGQFSAIRTIAKGTYSSLAYVAVESSIAQPLIFAINEVQQPTYFQADGTGKFNKVLPFGTTVKYTKMDAVRRTGLDADNVFLEWIELIAQDVSGNLWHVGSTPVEAESGPDSLPSTSISALPNGDYAVQKWTDPLIISAAPVLGFAFSNSGDGYRYLVMISSGGLGQSVNADVDVKAAQTSVLSTFVQDPATTDWTATQVTSTSVDLPNAEKQTVWYVEVAVTDSNRIQMPGLTAVVNAVEYAEIDINGITTSVDAVRSYTTVTNAQGKVCFTATANVDLSCPTFTLWVEGMEAEHRVDIQATGDLETKFANITVEGLKEAKDQTTGASLFASLPEPVLNDMASALNNSMESFSSKQVELGNEVLGSISRRYIHPRTRSGIARTRKRHERSLGHIHGNTGRAFHLKLRPTLSVENLSQEEAQRRIDEKLATLPGFLSSWGAFFRAAKTAIVNIVDVVVTGIKNAAKAVITFIKDGVGKLGCKSEYVWQGIASFVQQGFDLVKSVFDAVKCTFQKLFNWLAFLLNWDDIKNTAAGFRQKMLTFVENAKDCFRNRIPPLVDVFFAHVKDWLSAHFDSVIEQMNGVAIGTYDNDNDITETGYSVSSFIENLPSTATWLLNKIFNAPGGDMGNSLPNLDPLISVWQAFSNAVAASDISDDLKNAMISVTTFLKSLTTRGLIDGKTIGDLLAVFKNALILLIDVAHILTDAFLALASGVLDFIVAIFDMPIKIPILSKIFDALGWKSLTLWEIVFVPLSIPFTIAYKAIAGVAPFKATSIEEQYHLQVAAGAPDGTTLALGLLRRLWAAPDIFLDVLAINSYGKANLIDFGGDALKRVTNGFGLGMPILFVALNPFPTVWTGGTDADKRAVAAWVLQAAPVLYTGAIMASERMLKGPRNAQAPPFWRPIVLSVLGLFEWASPIWHCYNMYHGLEPNNDSTRAHLAGEFLSPVSNIAKFLAITKNPIGPVAIILYICDGASDVGCGDAYTISYIIASKTEDVQDAPQRLALRD